jgi:hypothetical protein
MAKKLQSLEWSSEKRQLLVGAYGETLAGLGWLMGLEPTTTGITIQGSTN